MTLATLRGLLLAAFPDAHVDVADLTGTSDHFEAVVVTRAFEGKSRIDQHKMVYAALGDHVGKAIHALALTTRTPDASAASAAPPSPPPSSPSVSPKASTPERA